MSYRFADSLRAGSGWSTLILMSNIKNMYNMEASLKYYIVQVLTSATLLFIVVIKMLTEDLFTFETHIHQ
jgi:hypothetical protein